jgi:hypothetical protein
LRVGCIRNGKERKSGIMYCRREMGNGGGGEANSFYAVIAFVLALAWDFWGMSMVVASFLQLSCVDDLGIA